MPTLDAMGLAGIVSDPMNPNTSMPRQQIITAIPIMAGERSSTGNPP